MGHESISGPQPGAPDVAPSAQRRPQSDVELGTRNCNPEGLPLWSLLREDYLTHERDLLSPGFWAVGVHRFGNWRMGIRSRPLRIPMSVLYKIMSKWVEWAGGISLQYTVLLGRRVRIWHQGGMTLGALRIGDDVHIRQNVTFGVKRRGDPRWLKPTIDSRCDIGAGAVIVGGITIGHDSSIGANVVVAQDLPPYSIATVAAPSIRSKRGHTRDGDARAEGGPS